MSDEARIRALQELICLLVYFGGGEIQLPAGALGINIRLSVEKTENLIIYKAVQIEDPSDRVQ